MAYSPIAFTAANYRDYANYWLKAYEPGTTTPKTMATDSTLSTLVAKAEINIDGFIVSAGGALLIPHINGAYDLWLFPTEVEADTNNTTNALRLADDITPSGSVTGNSTVSVFKTIGDLISMTLPDGNTATPSELTNASTIANNSDTNMGGANYKIMTIADYAAESPNPTPDGATVNGRIIGMDHYVGGGTDYVAKYNMSVGFDRACGTIGDDRILGATHDDHPALEKLFEWSKLNSPLDEGKIQKGYKNVFIHPRSYFYITAPIDLRSARTDYDFGQSSIVTSGAHSALYWEGVFCKFENALIEGLINATRADWLASGESLVVWGKDEPASFSNGSQVSFSNVRISGGYHCFELSSISPTDASFIWGSSFNECFFQDAVEHCYYFNSPEEVSTTMRYNSCHAGCNARDSVTIGAFDYFCLLHHVSDEIITRPEVGSNWEDYWHKEPTFTDRGAWVTGKQYITNAKGFKFFNVSSITFSGCSMDGGNNAEEGSVVDYAGQYIDLGVFHLEKFNHNLTNTFRPFYIVGDWRVSELALFNNRFKMPNATDTCYFIGGNSDPLLNSTRGTFEVGTNKAPDGTDGVVAWVDCAGFKSINLGVGVPMNSFVNPTGTTTAQRGLSNRAVKVLSSGTSTINYTPDTRENGVLFTSGDGLADNTLNITLDNMAAISSTDWNLSPQLDSYQMEFNSVAGPSGTGTINFIAGTGSPVFVGATTYSDGSTIRATKITGTKWLLEKVSGSGDGFVDYIAAGANTAGNFVLPDSKTRNDIAEIRMNGITAANDATSSVINFEKTGNDGLATLTFIIGHPASTTAWATLAFGAGTDVDATLTTNGGFILRSAEVKFR